MEKKYILLLEGKKVEYTEVNKYKKRLKKCIRQGRSADQGGDDLWKMCELEIIEHFLNANFSIYLLPVRIFDFSTCKTSCIPKWPYK